MSTEKKFLLNIEKIFLNTDSGYEIRLVYSCADDLYQHSIKLEYQIILGFGSFPRGLRIRLEIDISQPESRTGETGPGLYVQT